MAGILVPPFKLAASDSIIPRSTSITKIYGNTGGFSLSVGGTSASTAQLDVIIGSSTTIGSIIKAASSQSANLTEWQDSSANKILAINSGGQVQLLPTDTTISTTRNFIYHTNNLTCDNAFSVPQFFLATGNITYTATPGFGVPPFFFVFNKNVVAATNPLTMAPPVAYSNGATYTANTVAWTGLDTVGSFNDGPNCTTSGGGSFTSFVYNAFRSAFTVTSGTVDTRRAINIVNATGAGTLTNQIGIRIADLTKGGTLNIPIYCLGTTGKSRHQPQIKFGADSTPSVDVDINGGFATARSTVSLTADNQVVTVTNKSYIALSSDNATAANRTFVLSQGSTAGHLLVLEWVGTNAGELVDASAVSGGGNHRLSATWTPTQYDTLELIWNGTDWMEIGRSTN